MPFAAICATVAAPEEEKLQELGGSAEKSDSSGNSNEPEVLQQMGSAELQNQVQVAPADAGPPPEFYTYFAFVCGIFGLLLLYTTGRWGRSSLKFFAC